jgi:WW domain-containing oxidoreductase
MLLGLSLCLLLLWLLLLLPQVNFLSHWLLAHELLSEQRKRRAKAAKKNGSSSNASLISSSSSTALTPASISGSSMKGSKRAAVDAAACCGLEGTRLVMLSSLTHHAGSVQWGDKMSANGYNPFTSYALSKICNIIMAKEFQRRFDR